jgi:hypothetical protein
MDRNEYMRNWYASRIKSMHNKLGGSCVVCGRVDNLEIDHIDPTTKASNVTRLWNKSWEEINKELQKCQLLCVEHHREKSAREGSQTKNRLRGEENGSSKLTWELVHQIRQMYSDGASIKYQIAQELNINRHTVMRVVQNKTWVDPDYIWVKNPKNMTHYRKASQ